eukprot:CAMPEP_0204264298 /NCGR_PEP_ID=MMETSP0468-20130131/8926_1 /ASSEMBLY_ACC=CAM_ASM_000383 /TAXON_ID=2969 /ORGANISM="Oxyrrhis marina" /LENGTH=293 /DNA_ID=CAMNT_0051239159 /DNA_START=44 /DNA_END=925 /DNA_ORIENTATION=+
MSAMIAVVFTNPFDCVKTRMQLQGELMKKDAQLQMRYANTLDCGRKTFEVEGIRGLQRGLSTAIVREAVLNCFRVGAFEPILSVIHTEDTSPPAYKRMMAGLCSGMTAAFASNPLDLLKVRMQAQAEGANAAVGYQHGHTGFISGQIRIFQEEGVRGAWRGASASVARLGAGSASQLTVYSSLKEHLVGDGWTDGPRVHVFCSVVAVFAGTMCMQPFDVVRTRVMNQAFDAQGRGLMYVSPIDCCIKTVTSEGPAALYKGFAAHYLRGAPHVTLLFVILEQFKKYRPLDMLHT